MNWRRYVVAALFVAAGWAFIVFWLSLLFGFPWWAGAIGGAILGMTMPSLLIELFRG